MKILYHHRTLGEDAQGVHIQEMVDAFRQLGHDVFIVSLEKKAGQSHAGGARAWRWVRQRAGHHLYALMTLAYNAYGYWRLVREIKQHRPDVVYERYSLNTFCGVLASRRFGLPMLIEVNAPLSQEQSQWGGLAFRRLARAAERWICSNSTRTIVVSDAMKAVLARNGLSPHKMVVMPNGVNPASFHPGVDGTEIRRRYGLEGKLVVGFVGWFREWHRLDTLLQAMREARLGAQGVRLLLVGTGPAEPGLRRLADGLGIGGDVVFTGAVSRPMVAAHIAALDVAVQPDVTEYASPMKIFEYMALGKCIVAPDRPNIREILSNEVTGLLFAPGNSEEFKKALCRAVADHGLRESTGRRAWEAVQERRYVWVENARRVLELVGRRPEPVVGVTL